MYFFYFSKTFNILLFAALPLLLLPLLVFRTTEMKIEMAEEEVEEKKRNETLL